MRGTQDCEVNPMFRKALLRAATLVSLLGAAIWLGAGSASAAAPPGRPVAPNQTFAGSINGTPSPIRLAPALYRAQ